MTQILTKKNENCYFCGAKGTLKYHDLQDRFFDVPGSWSYRQCPKCKLVWIDPIPEAVDVHKLYTKYYTHSSSKNYFSPSKLSTIGVCYGYPDIHKNFWNKAVATILMFKFWRNECLGRSIFWLRGEERGRVLDIGCGNGGLLFNLKQLGWECVGFEMDVKAAETARNRYGIPVYVGNLDLLQQKEKPFDVITSKHVIEHLIDPIAELNIYKQLLRPGGKMIIATPNMDSLGSKWFNSSWLAMDPPRHFHIFNKGTLRRCLENAGLRVDSIRTCSVSSQTSWQMSRIIQKEKKVQEKARSDPPLYAKLGSKQFAMLENLLKKFHLGDELVAVATKG